MEIKKDKKTFIATVGLLATAAVAFADDPKAGETWRVSTETLLPLWVKAKAGGKTGYLPFPSIASEWLMENQNPDETISADGTLAAKRGFSESENDVALASMRGFSESENGEMAAIRGAAGSGKAAAKADPAAVTKVLAERRAVSDAEVSAFISAGGLAKSDSRKLKEEKVEEEGFFGGFMKTTRKVA